MSRIRPHTTKAFLLAITAVRLAAFQPPGDNGTCANPTGHPGEPQPKALESVADQPAAREAWFVAARKAAPGLASGAAVPPARRLLQSVEQIGQMPRPGGLAAASSWAPLGPAPQRSLYWGDVSGRVTSLAADTRGGKRTLYVGAAFGGLWATTDFAAARPHFTALGDSLWPSLAVGAIALDLSPAPTQPPVIYVGTGESNSALDSYYGIGIYKSTDGGLTWSLSTGRRLDPVSPSTHYDLDGPFVGAAIAKILIDPADRRRVLAAVTSSGLAAGKTTVPAIYVSTNAGESWSPMPIAGAPAGTPYSATDLVADPEEHAFYATVQGAGIYRLGPGESSWTATASPFAAAAPDWYNLFRASLATRSVNGETALYAVISSGNLGDPSRNYTLSTPSPEDTGIVQSFDGGEHWLPVIAPRTLFREDDGLGQGFYNQWIAAPSNSAGLLVGGIDVWSSPSATSPAWANATRAYDWAGGLAHPELHVHPDQHAVVVLGPTDWILGNDGGVWRTRDAGASWQNLNTDIDSIQFMSVTPVRGGRYLGGSQDNGTTVSRGPGQPWNTTLGGDGGYTADNPARPAQYFTERPFVALCRSDDFGQHWTTVVDGDTIREYAPFYAPYHLVRAGRDEILLGTRGIWLGPTMPATPGAGWRAISPPLTPKDVYVSAIAAAPASPQRVYAVTGDSHVWFNPDIHAPNVLHNWIGADSPDLPQGRVFTSIVVDTRDSQIAYVGIQGFGEGHLFRTDNGGKKWLDITPTATVAGRTEQVDTPVNAILLDPQFPSDVYLATDTGVFSSADRGASWQPHGTALPRTAILGLKMTADRKIVAATHGRGAWLVAPREHPAPAAGRGK